MMNRQLPRTRRCPILGAEWERILLKPLFQLLGVPGRTRVTSRPHSRGRLDSSGGKQTLRELVLEYKTRRVAVYRRTVQTTLRAIQSLVRTLVTSWAVTCEAGACILIGRQQHTLRRMTR